MCSARSGLTTRASWIDPVLTTACIVSRNFTFPSHRLYARCLEITSLCDMRGAMKSFFWVMALAAATHLSSCQPKESAPHFMLHPILSEVAQTLLRDTVHVSAPRKAELNALAAWTARGLAEKGQADLIFICTHNSRRSHLSQVWAQLRLTCLRWMDQDVQRRHGIHSLQSADCRGHEASRLQSQPKTRSKARPIRHTRWMLGPLQACPVSAKHTADQPAVGVCGGHDMQQCGPRLSRRVPGGRQQPAVRRPRSVTTPKKRWPPTMRLRQIGTEMLYSWGGLRKRCAVSGEKAIQTYTAPNAVRRPSRAGPTLGAISAAARRQASFSK